MDTAGQSTIDLWMGLSSFIQESYSALKQEFTDDDHSRQNFPSVSLLLTVGGQDVSHLLHNSFLSESEIDRFGLILSKVEELCLLKLILEYEKYKQSLQIHAGNDNVFHVLNNLEIDKSNSQEIVHGHEDLSTKTIIILTEIKKEGPSGTAAVNENFVVQSDCVISEPTKNPDDNQVSGTSNLISLHSHENTNNLPIGENTCRGEILSGEENVAPSSVRRSSRQLRVSSRYAENKDAIKSLLKPPVKRTTCDKPTNSPPESHSLCPICHKSFSNSKALKFHLKSHKQSSENEKGDEHLALLCKICGSKYDNLRQLKIHLRSHNQDKSELLGKKNVMHVSSMKSVVIPHLKKNSEICSIDKKEKKDLQGSQLSSAEVTFNCSNCNQTFGNEEYLEKHKPSCSVSEKGRKEMPVDQDSDLDTNKEQNELTNMEQVEDVLPTGETVADDATKSFDRTVDHYKCMHCSKVFRYKSHLNLHMTIHTGEKPHICEICGQSYRIKRSLILHRRTHDEMCRMKCEFCPKTYFDKKAFETHLLIHSGIKPYSCEVCGKGFRRLLGFKNHQRLHRQDEAFKCNECDKTFVDKWGMLKHKTVHSGEKPHVCMQCGKKFRLKKGLFEHIKVHNKDLQLKCSLCPRTFIDQRKLDFHLMAHKGKKPFICHKCGKGFMNATNLRIHDRCHTGEKPYKCRFCDMTFNQQGSHIAHERHHKGERPYVCEICGDGFITKSQLTVHTRRHFNDRPYKCDECDYAAYTGSILRVHMIKHSSEKPFKCQLCSSAFKRQHHLDVHSKTHMTKNTTTMTVNEIMDVVMYKCPYCSECFESEDMLTGHIDTHEIVVVTETTAHDDSFSNQGEPDEVAYNIVVL